jgi:hypothetical protein
MHTSENDLLSGGGGAPPFLLGGAGALMSEDYSSCAANWEVVAAQNREHATYTPVNERAPSSTGSVHRSETRFRRPQAAAHSAWTRSSCSPRLKRSPRLMECTPKVRPSWQAPSHTVPKMCRKGGLFAQGLQFYPILIHMLALPSHTSFSLDEWQVCYHDGHRKPRIARAGQVRDTP